MEPSPSLVHNACMLPAFVWLMVVACDSGLKPFLPAMLLTLSTKAFGGHVHSYSAFGGGGVIFILSLAFLFVFMGVFCFLFCFVLFCFVLFCVESQSCYIALYSTS